MVEERASAVLSIVSKFIYPLSRCKESPFTPIFHASDSEFRHSSQLTKPYYFAAMRCFTAITADVDSFAKLVVRPGALRVLQIITRPA